LLHNLFRYYFIDKHKSKDDNKTYLLSIPIIGSKINENNLFEGQGSIFLFIETVNSFEKERLGGIAKILAYIMKDMILNYLLFSGMELLNKSRKESIRSAIASIMSRNMSHNLGSHVLSRLNYTYSNKENIKPIINEREIDGNKTIRSSDAADIEVPENQTIDYILNKSGWQEKMQIKNKLMEYDYYVNYGNDLDKEKVKEEFISIGHFFKYLQNRQDYIATVTGSGKDIPILQNFKNDVLDELLISEKKKRHKAGEIKNLLLENIVLSEKISGKMIKVYFNNWDCINDDTGRKIAQNLNIALPSGSLGAHAFFSIFENFIRNSAKHSGSDISGKKELEIKIETPDIEWDENNKIIRNNHFAGKVFWIEQRGTQNPFKRGPYYIQKENNEYAFYAEIPFEIGYQSNKNSIIFDFKNIKDFANLREIEFQKDKRVTIPDDLSLKLVHEKEGFFNLIVLNHNTELRSYPICIQKKDNDEEKAFIFITNKLILEEEHNWEIKNIKIKKTHDSMQWPLNPKELKDTITINGYFNLKFDEKYYNPDEYIRFAISDNHRNYNKFYRRISEGLKEDLIDSFGRLLESNKGLKEMWISACWMRGEDINKECTYSPPIMNCVCNTTQSTCFNCSLRNNNHGSLQYIFFLKKAKELLFVFDSKIEKEKIINYDKEKIFNSHGIDFKSIEEYKNSENLHKYFVFIHNNSCSEVLKTEFDKMKNNRALKINLEDDVIEKISNKEPKQVLVDVMKKWIKEKWSISEKDKIYIIDDSNPQLRDETQNLDNTSYAAYISELEERLKNKGNNKYVWKKHFDSPEELKDKGDWKENINYIESITGDNKTGWLIRDFIPKDDYWRLSLLESAKCKILIIDERIWEEKSKMKVRKKDDLKGINKNIKSYFLKKNIEIWDLFIQENGAKILFYDLGGAFYSLLNATITDELKKFDIISIHQGIIDKIINNTNKNLKDLENIFNNTKAKKITHSGRSRPDSKEMLFGRKGNFISFTSLNSALNDSKYHLVNLLYSVRGARDV
jgi:hypothetical protein